MSCKRLKMVDHEEAIMDESLGRLKLVTILVTSNLKDLISTGLNSAVFPQVAKIKCG